MSSLTTELNATRSRPISPESEKPPPNCCHDVPECHMEVSVQTAPYTDFTVLSISNPPHQDMSSAAALDPFNHSRTHAPCQPPLSQLTAAECPTPQLDQYDPLTGPAPGPSDGSSAAAMWISEGTFLSGGMVRSNAQNLDGWTGARFMCSQVDSHQLVTVDVDSQWFGEGLFEASSHITHQVLCGDGGGPPLPPSQPGFWTLLPNDCASAGKGDDNISETPPQLQPAHSRGDGGIQTADGRSTASAQRTLRLECESRPRKTCHCTKSRCLKLYCDCFSSGMMCSSCNCINCHNNAENESQRHEAIKLCLGRNPGAFRSKGSAGAFAESRGWPGRGCSCRHSGCLKKYCDCYEANVKCTSSCRCVGCCNYDNRGGAAELVSAVGVETVCQSLMGQALHAEQRSLSAAAAERLLLEQFGRHLAQMVKKL
ncbi:protein lin-54 homolog isoform X2 [Oryzias latipes]|uniref:protein lin-54 homolog isoform X2 n=1 Tax=Oryzias latipes TaxID=8090 RepID=UPI0005CBA142|nr:protein lin-54 homolog isoform X2 [Oryzias latipes]XP_020557227.1 protein lin-54 homolog isoform X2 [Oryzias latipes]